ncbi:hypothetical protein [uncultured Cellulomonas sp.]|uniref:hypothetical protein n=1 Tax=uncultured Cellulomonas sp. TaxID=189682 RepID=UPI0028EEBDC2|nr:hypothetical protein [uncultured Cellulomonas sp.]
MTEHEPSTIPTDGGEATQPVRDLLAEHVPLALIVDLATPEATSAEILEAEGLPDEEWWDDAPSPGGGPA